MTTSTTSTPTRMHVAIATRSVHAAVPFYTELFGQEPTKLRADYAKFEVADPPVNFTLNQDPEARAPGAPRHFGIQVDSTQKVAAFKARLEAAGLTTRSEDGVTCCYAVQDKIWIRDPDGHDWEIFVVLDPDAPVHSLPDQADPRSAQASSGKKCCG